MSEMHAPRLTKLLKADITGSDRVLLLLGEDGRKYRLQISLEARGPVIDALQRDNPSNPLQGSFLTLKVLGLAPASNAEGDGILLRTQEWGTISLALERETISELRIHLAGLEARLPGGRA